MKKLFFLLIITMFFFSISYGQGMGSAMMQSFINSGQIPDDATLQSLGATPSMIQALHAYMNKNASGSTADSTPQPTMANSPLPIDSSKPALVQPAIDITQYPQSNIYGHSFFTNKNIALFNKATNVRAPDNYVLSIGDQIAISVWGYADYNLMFTIGPDGSIQGKDFGKIYIKGLKLIDAKAVITKKVEGFIDLKNSQIDITVVYSRVITVNIVGEVFSPGSYQIPAINTAFNALIAANGPNLIGSVRNIYIKRGSKIIRTLDVYKFLLEPQADEDFFLENNDYILVPPAEKIVSIQGEVKKPFLYELKANEDLHTLIKYAGGLTPVAYSKQTLVKSFKDVPNIASTKDINIDSILKSDKPYPLFDGDIIVVRTMNEFYDNTISIQGEIKVPAQYQFKEGEKITDLIDKAGGILNTTYVQRGYLVREGKDLYPQYLDFNPEEILSNHASPQNLKLQKHDVITLFSKVSFIDNDSISVTGAVRNPGYIAFGNGFTLKDALYYAGGLTKASVGNHVEVSRIPVFAKNSSDTLNRIAVLTATVNRDLTLSKQAEEFQLQPGDQIFINSIAQFSPIESVTINGEVNYPGTYTISKTEYLVDFIKRIGGMTEFAFPDGAMLTRQQDGIGTLYMKLNEALRDTQSSFNYILKMGDIITIPRINQIVSIQGAVNYINILNLDTGVAVTNINSPFYPDKRANYYIRKMGLGFAKNAWNSKTYVVQPGGFVDITHNYLIFNRYPKVKPGATIHVPESPASASVAAATPIATDWNAVINNITLKITAIVTLFILLKSVDPNAKL